jgi:phosphoglycolate phosphatase-like HAD superfamily hydrolase
MSYKARLHIDALIFSIDDVLVDVSASYREAVRQTVQLYLEQAIGLPPAKEPLLTVEEVILLQKMGHFVNYWDLAAALVMYFVEMLPPVPVPTFPSKLHVPALMAYLQLAGGRLKISPENLQTQKDIAQLAHDIAAAGGGIEGASASLPRMNRHLLVASGSLTKTNLVNRIFQELYLGADLFEHIYQQPAVVVQSSGYQKHEALVIKHQVLTQVADKLRLGVVSNRPRFEVEHTLRATKIEPCISALVTLDDMDQAKAKPLPDPWALLEAARHLQPTPARSAYIGANPADIVAARAANETVPFTAIACLAGAPDKEALRAEFEAVKASIILGHPNNLKELIE